MADNSKMIRVWSDLNIDVVKQHLILVDDHYGVCGNCRQTGLRYLEDKPCSGCGTTFQYLATKMTAPEDIGKMLSRIRKEGLKLKVIDRADYEKSSAKKAIDNLFK